MNPSDDIPSASEYRPVTDRDVSDIPDLEDKLGNFTKLGCIEMTVAELAAKLSGLPPMMEVYTDSDGVAMFINDTEVQIREQGSPFLRLKCSVTPTPPEAPSTESVDEQTARQQQRAMAMSAEIERASQMHGEVDG